MATAAAFMLERLQGRQIMMSSTWGYSSTVTGSPRPEAGSLRLAALSLEAPAKARNAEPSRGLNDALIGGYRHLRSLQKATAAPFMAYTSASVTGVYAVVVCHFFKMEINDPDAPIGALKFSPVRRT
ncbi:MAG: hypothetical protein WAU78_04130 [Roseiarcus sp.]